MGNVDSIPVISQVKSLVQVISGDVEGARETQENFRDTAPLVSQVTSLVHAINGDMDKARETQEKFVESLDEMSDGLPVIGHIKGGIYYAMGDEERGEDAMKSATGSLVSIAGGAIGSLAGPAGAVAGAALGSSLYDGVVTGVDTAIHGTKEDGSPQYYGTWNTYDKMGKGEASAGEIFDTVGMTIVDGALGALGAKVGKGKGGGGGGGGGGKGSGGKGRGGKGTGTIRCRRDVEYHLTSNEAEFVTSHQRLPGSVSEVLTAKWQHLSVPQTVSSLVSLFIILRMILWNDKNGRTYSRELCSFTIEPDYVERCQEALMKTLRRMEDHFASQKDDSAFVLTPDVESSSSITNNSTRLMIQTMATLYGILGSMGRGREAGVKWLTELCLYEDLGSYRICEEEVIHKLQDLNHKAFHLGEDRKLRIRRGAKMCGGKNKHGGGVKKTPPKKPTLPKKPQKPKKPNSPKKPNLPKKPNSPKKPNLPKKPNPPKPGVYDIPKLDTNDFNSIQRSDVGRHGHVRNVNKGKTGWFESNHVPAQSSYGKVKGLSVDSLPAHSLPYDIHQFAMRKVGTSKSSTVAKTLRAYEGALIKQGKMAEAIKLDITASYGRSNVLLDTNGNTHAFRPALVEYRNDLHAVINEHRLQYKITPQDAKNLHLYLEKQVNYWGSYKPTWNTWFNHMETVYMDIVKKNGLPLIQGISVPPFDRQYG